MQSTCILFTSSMYVINRMPMKEITSHADLFDHRHGITMIYDCLNDFKAPSKKPSLLSYNIIRPDTNFWTSSPKSAPSKIKTQSYIIWQKVWLLRWGFGVVPAIIYHCNAVPVVRQSNTFILSEALLVKYLSA